ncbi:MAG: T9SS type A sorting domain-containing protein [Bacteroidota bacterium]
MKKNNLLKLAVIMMFCIDINNVFGQITYQHTFPGPNSPSFAQVQLINMGNNDYKFCYIDYATNQLKLFNIDYSVFNTINVPVTLTSQAVYTIAYVTWSLFDCDTTMFEYAIMSNNYRNNFYIYRQDGTLLFERDSTIAPYCFGCFGGSYEIRPIKNSPDGSKLFLYKADSTGVFLTTDVYSLCGTLPIITDIMENPNVTASYVQEFPNPSSGLVEFKFDLPGNIQNYELIIYDSNGQTINLVNITSTTSIYKMEYKQFSSGTYFFTFNTNEKVLQTGKFIIYK